MKNLMTTTAMTLAAGAMALSATAANADDVDPKSKKYVNNSPITITGNIATRSDGSFRLNYGESSIVVEMDDWDWDDEVDMLTTGDRVTVTGNIDQDLFEDRKIEAGSVYSHTRNAFFYASADDEEDTYAPMYYGAATASIQNAPDDARIGVRGRVEDIDGREFMLVMSTGTIQIDTDEMDYNPMDQDGYQQIKAGDVVYVAGEMDRDFFEEKEIDAWRVVTLHKSSKTE